MSIWQLLRKEAHTTLKELYRAAGTVIEIATNSELILLAARETFRDSSEPSPPPQVTMRLWVDTTVQASPPWPQPHFRGLDHLVCAAFDRNSALTVDLRARRVIGTFSPAMAADRTYWTRIIFPALFGIVSPSVGVTALHCACTARSDGALLLAGASGSGKSTLALALAQNGFNFLSDDWTYFSGRDKQLLAWNSMNRLKLLPDAVELFPELAPLEPGVSANGELAYEIEPEDVFGVRRSENAVPRWVLFLERQQDTDFKLIEMASTEAHARLAQDLEGLPASLSDATAFFHETVKNLANRPCWLLRHGGNPHTTARALARLWENFEN